MWRSVTVFTNVILSQYNTVHKEFCLLGCNELLKVSSSFWGTCCLHLWSCRVSHVRNSMKHCCLLHVGVLFVLLFNPEDGDDMFLWNIKWPSTDYKILYLQFYISASCCMTLSIFMYLFSPPRCVIVKHACCFNKLLVLEHPNKWTTLPG
jgi:hypothetical protein